MTIELAPGAAAVREDWTRLAQGPNVFATWEWADAWIRHLGEGSELAIGVARAPDGRADAILPLYVSRQAPLRVVRFIGDGPADQLGPIHGAGVGAEDVGAALREHAERTIDGSGLFLGERIWGCESLGSELDEATVHRVPSPVLPIRGASFDDFLRARSRNFRSQVRRRERRLHRTGRVTYRLTEDPARLEADMAGLMRLHAATRPDSDAFRGARAAFHLDFARSALERGWLRLWTLELDRRPVAAWYGLRYGGVEFYYQAGRDPAYDALHVGFVLLNHTIRCAHEDGCAEYRFGRGGEGYKRRYAVQNPGLNTVALATGVRGELALAAVKGLLRLPPGTRQRLRGTLARVREIARGAPAAAER